MKVYAAIASRERQPILRWGARGRDRSAAVRRGRTLVGASVQFIPASAGFLFRDGLAQSRLGLIHSLTREILAPRRRLLSNLLGRQWGQSLARRN